MTTIHVKIGQQISVYINIIINDNDNNNFD